MLYYLATPYSKYRGGDLEAAFGDAARLGAKLVRAGVLFYSPIVHMHPIAMLGAIDPVDHTIWLKLDRPMMDASDALLIAHMDGWDESYGIEQEVGIFERSGRPIFDLDPETLKMVQREELS